MEKLLKELSESGRVLVAGSYARGEQREGSDIDFLVKTPRECTVYGVRNSNIEWVIKLLEKHFIDWNSTRTCYISTIGANNKLQIEMEFYDGFHRNKNKLPEVEIMGVKFKTW